MVRDEDERPQEDPLAMHCFCVCSGSALNWEISLGLADPGNVIFSLSCLFIVGFSCVYSLCIVAFFVFVLFCYNLMHVRCFGLVVNICTPPPSV